MTIGTFSQAATSYVPALILRHIEADPTPIRAARVDNLPCALLFADISGFTALTERLVRQGPAGVEELTRTLNAYFGRLVALITDHGGDVVTTPGTPSSSSSARRMAATCASRRCAPASARWPYRRRCAATRARTAIRSS